MADGTFSPVLEVAGVLREFRRPWFVAGGWAIDFFLGRVTRAHEDVDVAIFREDQLDLQDFLRGWRFTKIARGRRERWNERERLDASVQDHAAVELIASSLGQYAQSAEVVGVECGRQTERERRLVLPVTERQLV